MSAVLSRFANPAARIGHAGHQAPTLDDARALFIADLPAFPASTEPPYSCDSYLPPHMVTEIAEALHYAGQA